MVAPQIEYTPVRARRGKIVHAVSLMTGITLACGKPYKSFVVAYRHDGRLSCPGCKLEIGRAAVRARRSPTKLQVRQVPA